MSSKEPYLGQVDLDKKNKVFSEPTLTTTQLCLREYLPSLIEMLMINTLTETMPKHHRSNRQKQLT